MSNLSVNASVNYNDKRKSTDWRYKTHNTDLSNLDENKFTTRRIVYEIRNMFEMREMNNAQEQQIDDVSVQKLRENHETIQKLAS